MPLNKLDPSKLNSWKELKAQFDKEELLTIDKLMEERDRLKNFSVEWEGLFLDFTKNRISQSTLNVLIKLCHESDLKNNIECYFNGDVINETEKRSVLHTALRSQKNESEEIDKVVNDIRQKIINIADKVINGDKTGYTGKKFTDVVNIGIGGSHLGQEMVVEGLSPFSQNIKTHFVSNIDPDYTAKILEKLNPETTLFIIVSKSFNTIETINNNLHYVTQDGRTVFKHAVKGMADISYEVANRNNLKGEDIALFIPHQANKRIIDAATERLGLNESQVMINIDKYANTTAATIPICIAEAAENNLLNNGDNVILSTFGAGFSWGAMYLKWGMAYNA